MPPSPTSLSTLPKMRRAPGPGSNMNRINYMWQFQKTRGNLFLRGMNILKISILRDGVFCLAQRKLYYSKGGSGGKIGQPQDQNAHPISRLAEGCCRCGSQPISLPCSVAALNRSATCRNSTFLYYT